MDESFADRLRALREGQGLSQYALAKRSGISKQALSNLELSNREPTWVTVQRLALALGWTTARLPIHPSPCQGVSRPGHAAGRGRPRPWPRTAHRARGRGTAGR